jgi:hypothetical protein
MAEPTARRIALLGGESGDHFSLAYLGSLLQGLDVPWNSYEHLGDVACSLLAWPECNSEPEVVGRLFRSLVFPSCTSSSREQQFSSEEATFFATEDVVDMIYTILDDEWEPRLVGRIVKVQGRHPIFPSYPLSVISHAAGALCRGCSLTGTRSAFRTFSNTLWPAGWTTAVSTVSACELRSSLSSRLCLLIPQALLIFSPIWELNTLLLYRSALSAPQIRGLGHTDASEYGLLPRDRHRLSRDA